MRAISKTFGRTLTLAAAASLFIATSAFIPAEAATPKAGASCTKVNAKTKIKGDSYVCVKNPTVKNAKLTWVWVGCIDANKQYNDSVTRLADLKTQAAAAQTKIDQLKAAVPADEAKAKEYDAKAAVAKAKKEDALAQAADNAAKVTQYGATSAAGKAYQKNVDLWNKNANTYDLALKNFERAAKSLREKVDDIAKEQKRLDLSNQTIAASELEIKSNNTNRKQACTPGL